MRDKKNIELAVLSLYEDASSWAKKICGDTHISWEDVTQDAMYKAICFINNPEKVFINHGEPALKCWLWKIVYNEFIHNIRKYKRTYSIENINLRSNDDIFLKLESQEVINTMKEQDMDSLLLFARGLKLKEIAKELNIPEGTVKSSMNRSRKKLAEMYGAKVVRVVMIFIITLFCTIGTASAQADTEYVYPEARAIIKVSEKNIVSLDTTFRTKEKEEPIVLLVLYDKEMKVLWSQFTTPLDLKRGIKIKDGYCILASIYYEDPELIVQVPYSVQTWYLKPRTKR